MLLMFLRSLDGALTQHAWGPGQDPQQCTHVHGRLPLTAALGGRSRGIRRSRSPFTCFEASLDYVRPGIINTEHSNRALRGESYMVKKVERKGLQEQL